MLGYYSNWSISCQSKPHNSLSKLLFSPDWTIVMLSWRVFPHVLSSLCNWSRMQQPEWSLMSRKKLTYPSLHQVTLATNSRSHQIQGTDVCLQDHNWHCTNIPKLASSNLCALQKLAFCKWTTSCGAIPKRYQITLTDLFLDCAQLVEWPPNLNSNSWVFSHFQKTFKDASFSPAPDQLILTLTYSIYKNKKNPSYVYCARLSETCHVTCILLLSRWSDCFYCSPHLYVALDKSIC